MRHILYVPVDCERRLQAALEGERIRLKFYQRHSSLFGFSQAG